MKRLVIIETPYAGDVEANIKFARACMRDSLLRGEYPLASHLLYTQPGILDDNIPSERELGIDAGFAWEERSDETAFYVDLGMSPGMKAAYERLNKNNTFVLFRTLNGRCPCHYADEVWKYDSADSSGIERHCPLCRRVQTGTFPGMTL